jgi:hypothetical protein
VLAPPWRARGRGGGGGACGAVCALGCLLLTAPPIMLAGVSCRAANSGLGVPVGVPVDPFATPSRTPNLAWVLSRQRKCHTKRSCTCARTFGLARGHLYKDLQLLTEFVSYHPRSATSAPRPPTRVRSRCPRRLSWRTVPAARCTTLRYMQEMPLNMQKVCTIMTVPNLNGCSRHAARLEAAAR